MAKNKKLKAPTSRYSDPEAGELELRGSLTLGARVEYAAALGSGVNREDAAQRAVELLFEKLVVRWTVNGVATRKQNELLARYRAASAEERQFVREALRAHVGRLFPDIQVP
ncbi:MAG: hypothetical protein J2O48_06085 [Solirubrobacterales bacterium]|nr:hypothetical protein [Solirubrobacterales bacterium]